MVRRTGRKENRAVANTDEIIGKPHWKGVRAMPAKNALLTGRERSFSDDEIIVSKTDTKGRITYANQVFCRVAQYTEKELIGKPHNIVRHPHMPKCVFKYLWETIQQGNEIFAYVLNRAKNGDHYWVFAHVTPSLDDTGRIAAYHSNRRVPDRSAVAIIKSLYQSLLAVEQRHSSPRDAMNAALAKLTEVLKEKKMTYEELIFSLSNQGSAKSVRAPLAHAQRVST